MRERDQQQQQQKEGDGFQDRVVHIARVAKVVKGGRRFNFSALVVVGDGNGKVGYGVGKAREVPDAIRKASEQAKKNVIQIQRAGGTIPYEVVGKYGSASVIMNPAKKGKGIIAGGAVRNIVDLGGISDIVCKVHGTKNCQNVVRAAFNGLEQLVTIEEYSKRRDKDPGEVLQIKHAEKKQKTEESKN